ncbi:UNVERIFIED_CONTAM: putative late blight resistance proteinR1B-12 [Sesamum radiatum]|uniref:Late blight resistance proteinR1B-12 n=1 Tax=Sesamum radiatum TaxID=300843 RepID=A0AAW2PM97_SESRA
MRRIGRTIVYTTLSICVSLNHCLYSLNYCWRIAFPTSLKKLSLEFGGIPWEDMILIGSLPNLEILNLRNNAFKGYEWSPIEGQFLRLKQLSIQGRYPVRWTAESIHFPNLESLFLDGMDNLEEIPCDIGNIATLNYINLWECKDSVINSAKQILEEQQCNGNEDILLRFDMIPNVFS